MAERADEILELHRDERFVFDDEHRRRRFAVDLGNGILHEQLYVSRLPAHDEGRFLDAEVFQRGQQQRLAIGWSHGRKPLLRSGFMIAEHAARPVHRVDISR